MLLAMLGVIDAGRAGSFAENVFYNAKAAWRRLIGGQTYGNFAKADQCRRNLRLIESAKRRAAAEEGVAAGFVSNADIEKALGHKIPRCPAGGQYFIGPVVQLPACSISDSRSGDPRDDHIITQY